MTDDSPASAVLGPLLDGAIDAVRTAVGAFRRSRAGADAEKPLRPADPPDVPPLLGLVGTLEAALRAGRFVRVALADEQGLPVAETSGADADFLCATGALAVADIKRFCSSSRSAMATMVYPSDGRATLVVTFSVRGQELMLVAQAADADVRDFSALAWAVPHVVDIMERAADFSA